MSSRRRAGLDYDVAPDLVQPGAGEHQDGETVVRNPRAARLDYAPEPFEGARAPSGPSPSAMRSLRQRGLLETESTAPFPTGKKKSREKSAASAQNAGRRVTTASTTRTAPGQRDRSANIATTATVNAVERSRKRPGNSKAASPSTSRDAAAARHPSGSPTPMSRSVAKTSTKGPTQSKRSNGARADARTARTIRLAASVEVKLQRIAASFGVDLNAAVSIAVVHAHQMLTHDLLLDDLPSDIT